jgi:hypothetical protein
MSNEIAKVGDTTESSIMRALNSSERVFAAGAYHVECHDKDGNLKWQLDTPNLVVNVGAQYMCGVALTSTTQTTSWYLGLYGAAASNNPAAADTMASHAGWTEVVPYSEATRPQCVFAAATLANPSVATNSASKATFTINASATVGGAFLTSNNTKSGTTGTLFSAADFGAPGDRAVVSGDVLSVTYTFSLTAA